MSLKFAIILIISAVLLLEVKSLDFRYHNQSQLEDFLDHFTQNHRYFMINHKRTIGKTKNGAHLWVVEISGNITGKRAVPHVKLVGNIHGNEPVGRELILHLMEYFGDNYRTNATIRWLLDNTVIHLLPCLNPDGFAVAVEGMCSNEIGRKNGDNKSPNNEDLNRSFPDYYHVNKQPPQPETDALMKWMREVPFVLSAGLHGGALVANYPFDTVKKPSSKAKEPPSLTPDNDVFVHLAKTYSQTHSTMHQGVKCVDKTNSNLFTQFEGGITNGAEWYLLTGGMQDYNYAIMGCMELTLELSCCKYPDASELPELWKQNREALITYLYQAHRGVKGVLFDSDSGKPIENATLRISGRDMNFHSSKLGEFWRILLQGDYILQVDAPGYHQKSIAFHVDSKVTFLNVELLNSSVITTTLKPTTVVTTERLLGAKSTEVSGVEKTQALMQQAEEAPEISLRFNGDDDDEYEATNLEFLKENPSNAFSLSPVKLLVIHCFLIILANLYQIQ